MKGGGGAWVEFSYWPWYESVVFLERSFSAMDRVLCKDCKKKAALRARNGRGQIGGTPPCGGLFKPRSSCLFGLGSV